MAAVPELPGEILDVIVQHAVSGVHLVQNENLLMYAMNRSTGFFSSDLYRDPLQFSGDLVRAFGIFNNTTDGNWTAPQLSALRNLFTLASVSRAMRRSVLAHTQWVLLHKHVLAMCIPRGEGLHTNKRILEPHFKALRDDHPPANPEWYRLASVSLLNQAHRVTRRVMHVRNVRGIRYNSRAVYIHKRTKQLLHGSDSRILKYDAHELQHLKKATPWLKCPARELHAAHTLVCTLMDAQHTWQATMRQLWRAEQAVNMI